jgi:predicted nucleic acid-binding protein
VTGIVIDASVTLSWCFPDEQTPMSLNVLDRLKSGEQALVPAFWSLEVLNTLLLGERKGRINPEQTKAFLDALRVLSPAVDYASLEQVAGPVQIICRDHRLTPYDALYVELAQRSGCPLATLDRGESQEGQSRRSCEGESSRQESGTGPEEDHGEEDGPGCCTGRIGNCRVEPK